MPQIGKAPELQSLHRHIVQQQDLQPGELLKTGQRLIGERGVAEIQLLQPGQFRNRG